MTIMSTLIGHNNPVQELTLNESKQHLMSLSADKVLKIWDMKTYQCLQTIEVKQKFRPVDMITAMEYDEIRHCLLLCTRKVNFAVFRSSSDMETSHLNPVSWVIYNTIFEIAISSDELGNVIVWDIDSFGQVFKFSTGDVSKMTSGCLDDKQRRLMTGTHSGCVRVWNFSNGQKLAEAQILTRKEVSALAIAKQVGNLSQQPYILSAGWDRAVHVWPDSKDEDLECVRTIPPAEYQGESRHNADITCMAIAYNQIPCLIITGALDGSLFAWIYETGYSKYCLHEVDESCLRKRGETHLEKAVEFIGVIEEDHLLVTGAADQTIRLWNLAWGSLEEKFLAAKNKYERLTAGKVNEELKLMTVGDSSGNISLWSYGQKKFTQLWARAAHKDPITCMELLKYKEKVFILTGGIDKNLMLHSEKGFCIGIFSRTGRGIKGIDTKNARMAKYHPGFTSEVAKDEEEKKEASKKKEKVIPYPRYIAPFSQVDMSLAPMNKANTNYDAIFKEKVDRAMDCIPK
eukprot:TRINITY_DN6107_c0_g2_i9.p1 TRINITY_DN6107_c0_g2~~TRINITY_DN6107_c0_g2_i9.p1  ORF type:complete len:516 (+),score=173.95 TRINITY_DN6107_c0_g2_i9:1386-2933(+)